MIIKCENCNKKFDMLKQGIDEFCCVDCMIEYFTEEIWDDSGCSKTEQIVEDIIDRAYEAGQWSCECDM
jgi:hypothetical protein